MAELKTKPTKASVKDFLRLIPHEGKRKDALTLLDVFQKITGEKPTMWGTSIIGFGTYHYHSPTTSREGDWFLTGFSPRAQNLTLYIMSGFAGQGDLLKKLGKHKTGGGCLYINKLADVDMPTLKTIIRKSMAHKKRQHT